MTVVESILARVRVLFDCAPNSVFERLPGLTCVDPGTDVDHSTTSPVVRRQGPRTVEHVPTGRTYRSPRLVGCFHSGYESARHWDADRAVPSSSIGIAIAVDETPPEFVHQPSGRRFECDLTVQVFAAGWAAGRPSPDARADSDRRASG